MTIYHDLAEAMRKGAALRPQTTGKYFDFERRQALGSCALGAIYESVTGHTAHHLTIAKLEDVCGPIIGETSCPVENCDHYNQVRAITGDRSDFIVNVITHLNDYHHWTREAIADWLCTLDTPQVQP